ncbi:hypothetical protein REJC140_03272 [Pseudorhizobium endolithicum]|uniref:Uncharacterized protein n=2 Tax=Pseudorhizobium endolithicum TaxID=1191678 RepID=A0ABM8PK54_9HYPH|nr:hypothetical protein [Pseudorhizobium endolithicum]CAD7034085.1 hypothetical protein REJC140_03272 [Pseudorhizobium endolithicum]
MAEDESEYGSGEARASGGRKREAEIREEQRQARAAAKLRENLLRRKAQTRARRSGAADEADGLPAAKKDESP